MYGLRTLSRPMSGRCHLKNRLVFTILICGCCILFLTGCLAKRSTGDRVAADPHRTMDISHSAGSHSHDSDEGGMIVLQPDYLQIKDDYYGGSEACRACHSAIYSRWKESVHGRSFDPDQRRAPHNGSCLQCHNIANESSVGCESCHGPRGSHVRFPGRFHDPTCRLCEITRECIRCHTRAIDPEFRASRGWKVVGHGAD